MCGDIFLLSIKGEFRQIGGGGAIQYLRNCIAIRRETGIIATQICKNNEVKGIFWICAVYNLNSKW